MNTVKYAQYTQISPERDVTADGFSRGQINFKLNMDSMSRWNPYRSYLRMRISLSKANGNALDLRDGIAPNMFQGDCFWQQMNIRCNGVKVSEIDDYVPQVSALKQRYSLPESRRKEFLSKTNFASSKQSDRMIEVSSDGFDKIDPVVRDFRLLVQNDGTGVLDTEEFRVENANLNRLQYRSAADAADGAIDLTESDLQKGDSVVLLQDDNVYFTSVITAVNAKSIDVENEMTAFVAEDVSRDVFLYTKTRPSRRVKEYELCFKPCMGLFSLDNFLPGNWKLELTPHTNTKYQRYAIESLLNKVPTDDYLLSIVDLQLYIWKGRYKSVVNKTESYDFTEIRCQAQTITTQSLLNKAFVVNQDSHTFSIAYQKPDAGDDTRFSKTKFKMADNYEKSIQRFQLRINGETLPNPLPDIDTQSSLNRDFATQQYYEMLHYNGTVFLDEPEGLDSWFERGPYYSYVLPKRIGAKSNRLYVSNEFRGTPPENFLLLVFDHYYKGFKLDIENGLVRKCHKNVMLN